MYNVRTKGHDNLDLNEESRISNIVIKVNETSLIIENIHIFKLSCHTSPTTLSHCMSKCYKKKPLHYFMHIAFYLYQEYYLSHCNKALAFLCTFVKCNLSY